jgi:hypothetical protein
LTPFCTSNAQRVRVRVRLVSTESFVLCQNYTPPQGYVPTIINPMLDYQYGTLSPFLTST